MGKHQRDLVQAQAKRVGHCVCSKEFSCECRWYLDTGECHCAGEGDLSPKGTKKWLKYNLGDNS